VIGDAAVDLIPEEDDYLKLPGGTGANISVALSRLGANSALITKVGSDPLASFLIDTLKREKVDTENISICEKYKTNLIKASIDETGERHFTYMAKPSADSQLNNSNIPTFKKEDWLCISGFIFVQRPSREATFFAIKQAKSVGSTVCVDANIRLDMWDDESLVIPTTLKALKEADIAKMSDDELLLLTNSKSVEEGVRKIKHWPSKVKIITLGVKGAILLTDKSEFQIKGYNVPTVDMTGAGDAFIGALVSKLIQLKSWTDDALIKAIKFSNACGALVVGKKGAMSALPDLETVNKFMTGDH
tara:strand:- start:1481 stop:2389 length:909 start_codon:yes stop_codon:yes gene_type:complete